MGIGSVLSVLGGFVVVGVAGYVFGWMARGEHEAARRSAIAPVRRDLPDPRDPANDREAAR